MPTWWRLLALPLTFACCTPAADLPESGGFSEQLVRLEGAPEHANAPTRLRVLVAELDLGVDRSSDAREYDEERVERFAEYAVVYQPDVFVVLDAPFGGSFIGLANPSEALAVAVDRFYRVELRTAVDRRNRQIPVSPASGGTLVLSEYPMRPHDFETPTARPLAPMYLPPYSANVELDAGSTTIELQVRDGTPFGDGGLPAAGSQGLLIGRGNDECRGLSSTGVSPICLAAPGGWELLRHEILDDYAGLGLRAIKAEYRLASAPVATE